MSPLLASRLFASGELYSESEPMDVLVIAPEHHDLPNAASEIASIQRYHNATVLSGTVRESDIAAAVEDGAVEIIWWITHGTSEGVLLSDGVLSIAGVGQYVRACDAKLCVLNTCDSETAALSLLSGGRADVICTIGAVGNKDAIRLGGLLAGELASSETYYDAFRIVAPTGGLYRYLKAGTQYRRRADTRDDDTLGTVRGILFDDPFGRPGLPKRVSVLEERANINDDRVNRQASRLDTQEVMLKDHEARILEWETTVEKFSRSKIAIDSVAFVVLVCALVIIAAGVIYIAIRLSGGGTLDGQIGIAIRSGIRALGREFFLFRLGGL